MYFNPLTLPTASSQRASHNGKQMTGGILPNTVAACQSWKKPSPRMAPGTAARVHLSLLPCLASLSSPFERLLPIAGRGWRLLAPLARLKVFRELANSVAPSTVPVKFLQWLPSHRECTRLASISILPNFLPFSNLDPDQTLSSYLGLTSVSRRRMIPPPSPSPFPTRLPRFCSLHRPPSPLKHPNLLISYVFK